jgi:hypothetical protein
MSRSYKHKPFAAICGGGSAKKDKIQAHRGERRKQNRVLYAAFKSGDFENLIIPHKRECPWNEVYSWGRDGNQHYLGLDDIDHFRWMMANGFAEKSDREQYLRDDPAYMCWPPLWYQRMMRK